jgi:hypothetical protein
VSASATLTSADESGYDVACIRLDRLDDREQGEQGEDSGN